MQKRKTSDVMKRLIEKAQEFHSHLGPFLVLGLRMGQTGQKELHLKAKSTSLRVFLRTPANPPCSCVIDGIQITTGCTVGNRRLTLEDSNEIVARFENSKTAQKVTVVPHPKVLTMLQNAMENRNFNDEKLRELAWIVASMTSQDLCIVNEQVR